MTTTSAAAKAGGSPLLIALKFIFLALLWGSSFFFIKIAMTTLSWGQVAWSRVVAGGIFMLVFWLISREKLPRDLVTWGHIAVAGVFGIGIPFIFFPWAEQFITSAVATIYNGLTPIMTAIIAVYVLRVENFNRNQAAGVLVGLAGLVVVIALDYYRPGGKLLGPDRCPQRSGDVWILGNLSQEVCLPPRCLG
ncbi:MAG: DMT family transporter [Aurantimicrobium sp.]